MYKILLTFICIIFSSCGANKYYDKYDYIRPDQKYNPQYRPIYNGPVYYQQPNSRLYTNPYNLPNANSSSFYDSDQYYIPPTNYYNIETDRSNNQSPANNKY